jgi:hypothetical protein
LLFCVGCFDKITKNFTEKNKAQKCCMGFYVKLISIGNKFVTVE